MERTPIKSSNLISGGYDADREVLELEFKGGGVYEYHGVHREDAAQVIDGSSPGTYFAQNIRNRYRTVRIS